MYELHEYKEKTGVRFKAKSQNIYFLQDYALETCTHWFIVNNKDKIMALSGLKIIELKRNKKSIWSKIKKIIKI